MFRGQMPRKECLRRALKEGPQVGWVEVGKGKARQGKEAGKCSECRSSRKEHTHQAKVHLGRWIGARYLRVQSDRTPGLYLMENGKPLDALSRRASGLISYISIGQVVEEVTSSYNPGRSRAHTSGMDLEAGVIKILLYGRHGATADALCDSGL